MAEIRYKRLAYVALDVTDRVRSTAFHERTIGLEVNPLVDSAAIGATLMRGSAAHCELALYDAAEPGLRRIAFEMENNRSLEVAAARLAALGVRTWEAPAVEHAAFAQRSGFRFAEPTTGLTVELFVGDGVPPPPLGGAPRLTNITRIGHVVVCTVEPKAMAAFFLRELNFRASDIIDQFTFMRCFPNPLHHSLAVTPGPENRLNHVNFLVDSIDDVGRAINRTKQQNVEVVYGPGRHPPSGSVFLYFLDPDGMTFELSTGMEEFPEVDPREPRHLPMVPESFNYWGSQPNERFAAVGRFRRDAAADARMKERV